MRIHKLKRVHKRICALLMIVTILFCSTYNNYEEAHAAVGEGILVLETTIAVETAIAWLMAAFGFTAASVVVYENRDSIIAWGSDRIDDFEKFCTDVYAEATITAENCKTWLDDLAKGILRKGDVVYRAFKDWLKSLSDSTTVSNIADVKYDISQAKLNRKDINTIPLSSYDGDTPVWDSSIYAYTGFEHRLSWSKPSVYLTMHCFTNQPAQGMLFMYYSATYTYGEYLAVSLTDFYAIHNTSSGTNGKAYDGKLKVPAEVVIGNRSVYIHDFWDDSISGKTASPDTFVNRMRYGDFIIANTVNTYPDGSITSTDRYKLIAMSYLDYLGLLDDGLFGAESPVKVGEAPQRILDRDGTLDNYDLVSPVIGEATDVITIPWDRVGEYDINGVLDITDVLDQPIADVVDGVAIPVDTAEDRTIVDDIPITDVVVDTTGMSDYTMKGLENVFPFCLPFDFINFINCLCAEPEAPKFEWHMDFLQSFGMESYTLTIDLATFNSVAKIMRIMELLSFIIGLIMITRSMFIRG